MPSLILYKHISEGVLFNGRRWFQNNLWDITFHATDYIKNRIGQVNAVKTINIDSSSCMNITFELLLAMIRRREKTNNNTAIVADANIPW